MGSRHKERNSRTSTSNTLFKSPQHTKITDTILIITAGFLCGLLLLCSFSVFLSSTLIRTLFLAGIVLGQFCRKLSLISKALRDILLFSLQILLERPPYKSISEAFQEIIEISFIKLGGRNLGEEMITHFREQHHAWKRRIPNYTKTHIKFMVFLLTGELLWGIFIIKLQRMFERQRSR